jgi:glycosyltransferase involved in cell wall biosynthesis
MFKALTRKIKQVSRSLFPLRVFDCYPDGASEPRGDVLISYLPWPLLWSGSDNRFLGHSHCWESVEIVRIFNKLGYRVDAISWDDKSFVPRKKYHAVFDILQNLSRYSDDETCKILHITTSYPTFSNFAERARLKNLSYRRGVNLKSRRSFSEHEIGLFDNNIRIADVVTLLGNDITRGTFPEEFGTKIVTVNATGSALSKIRDISTVITGREFLWFNGVGAVHKGLDLVLEVFAAHPECTLHVVGPYENEKDFIRAYRKELRKCSNVKTHGYLYPSSPKFQQIVENVMAFINPTCSEGMSTSAITCMEYGLIPIISLRAGLSLPDGLGIVLLESSHEEIERAIVELVNKSDTEIMHMIQNCQSYALRTFAREKFSSKMQSVLGAALDNHYASRL